MRIWYQSYVDYENGKTYWDRLRKHLEAVVDPGTTVEIKGITPHDSYAHALVEMRCAREVICNAVRAEREGYDAFVIGHFQDAGLYEARSAVGIPVVALGEASMLYSCQLGQHSGIVASGADVLIPGGGIPMLLFSAIRGHTVDGAPVINGIPIVAKMAEMAVKLRRLAGLGVSRVSDYIQPPIEILEEFLTHPKGL